MHRVRIGASAGDHLVGWSHGRREPGGQLYAASSAVLPPNRRQGVYTRLPAAIEEQAVALGCHGVISHQRADDSAVLIAKLKAGYVICGMEFSSEMGLLAKLARPGPGAAGAVHRPDRRDPGERPRPLHPRSSEDS